MQFESLQGSPLLFLIGSRAEVEVQIPVSFLAGGGQTPDVVVVISAEVRVCHCCLGEGGAERSVFSVA